MPCTNFVPRWGASPPKRKFLSSHHTWNFLRKERQSFWTGRARVRLLYFGPVSCLRLSIWPLGGAKYFYVFFNISLIFETVEHISIPYGSTPLGLHIPPCLARFSSPVGGRAPQNDNFCHRTIRGISCVKNANLSGLVEPVFGYCTLVPFSAFGSLFGR